MTSKERFRRRICGLWWRFKGEPLPTTFSIPKGGLKPEHLAVVMPPEFHDFDVALHVLEPLIERLNPYSTSVLIRQNFRTWLSPDLGARIVCFDSDQKDWIGFPKDTMCRTAKSLAADVVVDLTPGFSPYTAALAAATGAPLRISLDTEQKDNFYNFFVTHEEGKSLAERYEILLRYV
jgi:ADP-heptose:LPS heptosyltransferase